MICFSRKQRTRQTPINDRLGKETEVLPYSDEEEGAPTLLTVDAGPTREPSAEEDVLFDNVNRKFY